MIIRLPNASGEQEYKAKAWFVSLPQAFRGALDAAVQQAERSMGSCEIFVEGHFKGFQPDLLFAFRSQIAVCEIKNHWDDTLKNGFVGICERGARQACEQADAIRMLLALHGTRGGIHPFLFLPNAQKQTLETIDSWLHDTQWPHLQLAGVTKEAHGRRSRLLYLPHQINLLQETDRLRITDADQRVHQLYFESSIGRRWHEFRSFVELGNFLDTLPPRRLVLTRKKWHVAEIRQDERERGLELLRAHRVLELVGAPGIGKSSLIDDILDTLAAETSAAGSEPYEFHQIALKGCHDAASVKRTLLTALGLAGQGGDVLPGLLASQSVIAIHDRDNSSHTGLREFLAEIEGRPGNCLWVFESHLPLWRESCRLELRPMSVNDLTRILRLEPPGMVGRDAERIADAALGNPRVAHSMWVSPADLTVRPAQDSVRWFVETLLSTDEIEVLRALCYVMHLSPLGVPARHLQHWLEHACPQVPNRQRRETALGSLLGKLQQGQLAHVDSIPAATLAALGLGETQSEVLLSIDQVLITRFVQPGTVNRYHGVLQELLQLHWLNLNDDVVGITAELLDGRLDAFLRSSYRRSHLSDVLSWLGQREFDTQLLEPRLAPQLAAYKALKLLEDVAERNAPSVQEVAQSLSTAREHDAKVVHYARRMLEGHAIATQARSQAELNQWASECRSEADLDLRAEMLVRLAVAHQRTGDTASYRNSWLLLQDARSLGPQLGLAVRSLVEEYCLGFLNRTKESIPEIPNDRAKRAALISTHARELLQIALALGNLSLAGAAVFYYVRASEYLLAHENNGKEEEYRLLLTYLPALEFVERVSKKHRLQAVLTQGSIHRHAGRLTTSGPALLGHAVQAMVLYERVLHGALLRRHWGWAIDAVAYMADVCLKELRNPFDSYDEAAVRQVVGHAGRVARATDKLRDALANAQPQLLPRDKRVMEQCQSALLLVRFVERSNIPAVAEEANAAIADLSSITELIQSLLRWHRTKDLTMLLRDVHRALRFAWGLLKLREDRHAMGPRSRETLGRLLAQLEPRLRGSRDQELRKRVEALHRLVNG